MAILAIGFFIIGAVTFLSATKIGRGLLKSLEVERPELHEKYFSFFNQSYYYWGLIFGDVELDRERLPESVLKDRIRVKKQYEISFLCFFLFFALLIAEVLITSE